MYAPPSLPTFRLARWSSAISRARRRSSGSHGRDRGTGGPQWPRPQDSCARREGRETQGPWPATSPISSASTLNPFRCCGAISSGRNADPGTFCLTKTFITFFPSFYPSADARDVGNLISCPSYFIFTVLILICTVLLSYVAVIGSFQLPHGSRAFPAVIRSRCLLLGSSVLRAYLLPLRARTLGQIFLGWPLLAHSCASVRSRPYTHANTLCHRHELNVATMRRAVR